MNYNNKNFRAVSSTQNGEVSGDTLFEYKQEGNVLTASYAGGQVIKGHLIGLVDNNGVIKMSYHQVNLEGCLRTGVCVSKPEVLDNGKLILHESWEWTSGNKSKGKSILEEV